MTETPTGAEHVDPNVARLLDAVTTHIRPLVLERFDTDSCIASTRATIDVLQYFGIEATPIPVSVFAMNEEASAMLHNGATFDEIGRACFEREPEDPEGPWTIGLGVGGQQRPTGSPGWAGHLMAGIRSLDVLVDNSIDQMSRPIKRMVFDPVWMGVPTAWWDSDDATVFTTGPGITIMVEHNTIDPDGFRVSTNWSPSGPNKAVYKNAFKEIAGSAIRAIRADLAATN